MQIPFSGISQPRASRVDTLPYGYGAAGRLVPQQPPPQHIKGTFGTQPGDAYATVGPHPTLHPGNAYIIMTGSKIQGILTSKDILMRAFRLWTLGIRCNAEQRCCFLDPLTVAYVKVGNKEATIGTLGMQQTLHLPFLDYPVQ